MVLPSISGRPFAGNLEWGQPIVFRHMVSMWSGAHRRRSRSSRSPPRPPSRLRPREGAADLTTVVHSCTLFNAPCEVHSETSERKVCAPIDRSRQSPCTAVFRARMKVGTVLSAQALREIAQVEAEIDRVEAQTIERLGTPPDNQVQQLELLGKLMLYDKQLSVNRNEACAFCHMPETGFTGTAAS